ncbi:MAG: 30S ribosomal protein S20 [Chloroflexota bacterium]
MTKGTTAEKVWRRSEKARASNRSVRSATKTAVDRAEELVKARDLTAAAPAVKEAASALDRAAKKGVIHPNAAARGKARLVRKLNVAQAKGAREA